MKGQIVTNKSARLKKKTIYTTMWDHRVFYMFLIPAFIVLILFSYRPYLWLSMAFQDYKLMKGVSGSSWVGIQNFIDIFTTPKFYQSISNTFGINLLAFAFGFPAPIILGLMINDVRSNKFKRVVQTITYLPHFLSWVIVAGLFYLILDEDMGVVNAIISQLGLQKVSFLREAKYFWNLIISTSIWKEVGYGTIIYLASLTSIDPTLYEAATVDGAGRWKQMLHVTLPGIMPTIAIMLILTSGKIATGGGIIPGFDALLNMQNPMVYERAETLQIFSYSQGIIYNRYSFAAAIGIVESLVAFGFVFSSNYLAKKFKGYGLF